MRDQRCPIFPQSRLRSVRGSEPSNVERRTEVPDQRLTIEQAVESYTKGPAWASVEEDRKGTLTAGKLTDVAVFDTNLIDTAKSNPSAILKAKVLYTIVGGRIVYGAGAASAGATAGR